MKDNTLRDKIKVILRNYSTIDNEIQTDIDPVREFDKLCEVTNNNTNATANQLEALLAEEVRKAIEKIAQENTVNFFGIQEGSDISTKKKWVQVIKTQDILEQLEKEGK